MKQKFLFLLFLLSLTIPASAYDFAKNNGDGIFIYYNKINGGTAVEVTRQSTYSHYSGDVQIPKTVTDSGITYPVVAIGDDAFKDCSELRWVVIPNSVKSIGNRAFQYCTGLQSALLPESLMSIGADAFEGCSQLSVGNIPDSVTSIGQSAFLGTLDYKKESNWEDKVLYIGKHLIDSESGLGGLSGYYSIKEGTLCIADYAFSGCIQLTSVNLPESVTSIGKSAFNMCSGLASVTIPNSVKSIGSLAFDGCNSLTSVTIPESVTSIGYGAFIHCDNLTEFQGKFASDDNRCLIVNGVLNSFAYSGLSSYIIPQSVISIGESAFLDCASLTSVTIPNSVTSIGNEAFRKCRGLTSMTIPDAVSSIGKNAFYGCSGLTSVTIGNSVNSIDYEVFAYCSLLTSITFGNSVTSIGDRSFYGCSSLASVSLPNSVTSIGSNAFYGCSSVSGEIMKDLLFKAYELKVKIRFTPIAPEDYEKWVGMQGKNRWNVTILGHRLTAEHIALVTKEISEQGMNIDSIQRLTGRIPLNQEEEPMTQSCVEFSVRGNPADLRGMQEAFMQMAASSGIDISLQEDTIFRRCRRLICFDMDSTLIETEVIDELAKRAGVGDKVKEITERAMHGEIDFTESFKERVALLEGLDESVMKEIAENLPITRGVGRMMQVLKRTGFKTAILSGGFTYFGNYLKQKFGFDYVYANELEIKDGKLTGRHLGEIVDGRRKAELLKLIAQVENLNIAQTIAVGDGANDLPMLATAGLGIAFHAKPKVKEAAEQSISTIGIDGVLYFLGFKDTFENVK